MNLFDIKEPADIQQLSIQELQDLSKQIRKFLLNSISKTGGHLSSNLGIVELTVAMHYVFNSPKDKFIYDVGHQSYVHKILTGRIHEFAHLRQYKGLSGFQKRKESIHDPWEAGHSSTSLSAALGMAVARDLNQESYHVLPIIGDGALTGGMAMEALNQIGSEQRKMIIIFNDNHMSISKNVGAIDQKFNRLRTSKPYMHFKHDLKGALSSSRVGKSVLHTMKNVKDVVKDNIVDTSIFGEFHLHYIGPVDGHDLPRLINVLEMAKDYEGPVVVHVLTKKGKGYSFAENDVDGKWHGVSQFDLATGKSLSTMPKGHLSWSEVMSKSLCDLAETNKDIVAITPAMIGGSKLDNFFSKYPDRSFDCGIAEEHAMTFAAGLCTNGKRPFISIYSSFLQRAYDQVNHDVARMKLPVVIGIDRCGLVGEDGETHHGVFDIALLRHIPNMVLSQPKDAIEAQHLLYTAFSQNECPFAIRYPRGNTSYEKVENYHQIPIGSWEKFQLKEESKVVVITYGDHVDRIISKAKVNDLAITVVNARFFKPLDEEMLLSILTDTQDVIIYETDIFAGGLGSAILEFMNKHRIYKDIQCMGIQDCFVEQGSVPQLRKTLHLDMNTLFEMIGRCIGI